MLLVIKPILIKSPNKTQKNSANAGKIQFSPVCRRQPQKWSSFFWFVKFRDAAELTSKHWLMMVNAGTEKNYALSTASNSFLLSVMPENDRSQNKAAGNCRA